MADGGYGERGVSNKMALVQRLTSLESERSSWMTHWQELAEHLRPRGSRLFSNPNTNRGDKVNDSIIDSTPLIARRTTEAGMMSGITSPSRPWFRYTTPDARVAEGEGAKEWLRQVEEVVREHFQKSNVYEALHLVYSDLITFGTSAMLLEEDEKSVFRAYVFPIGQYCLSNSARLTVDTCFRKFKMTVRQLVQRFGEENCSTHTKSMWANKNSSSENWVEVVHAIVPNEKYKKDSVEGNEGKKWLSCWFETGGEDKFLRESGYGEFPILAPRWAITGEDVYGYCPGMDVLADCKELQLLAKREAQAFDKVVRPPMQGPSSLYSSGRASLLPGVMTPVDGAGVYQPSMTINPQALPAFAAKRELLRQAIREGLYSNLWLMVSQADNDMTATEVVERREEKLLQLGTVLERLQNDLLSPLHERAFSILLARGLIPPPPEELQGGELRIEFLSNMAQAQKAAGIVAIQRFLGAALQAAQAIPSILDKVDSDQIMDETATMLGVPPGVVRTDEEVAALREQRAQAQADQAKLEQTMAAAESAKTLSQSDTEGKNALTDVLKTLGAA